MDPLSTSIEFDQSFSCLLKAELEKQQTLIDSEASTSIVHNPQLDWEPPDNPESTTHYIKVYREQLETLQKDNFSLKIQLFYFQRAFENAGITEIPKIPQNQEIFARFEEELLVYKRSLIDAGETNSRISGQNNVLQRNLLTLERRCSDNRDLVDKLSFQLNEKENTLEEYRTKYDEALENSNLCENRCRELHCCVTKLENEIRSFNVKGVAQTGSHISHPVNESEVEEDVLILQNKNSKIIEFARPLAQKLQETQEELELANLKCQQQEIHLISLTKSNELLLMKYSELEKEFSDISKTKCNLLKQNEEILESKSSLEQITTKDDIEKENILSKLQGYEDEIHNTQVVLLEKSNTIKSLTSENAIVVQKLNEISDLEESLIQSKIIISKLELKIEELLKQNRSLQRIADNFCGLEELKQNQLLQVCLKCKHMDDENEHTLDAIFPEICYDSEELQPNSRNLSLLLSIYKELLTTQKYLSRAKKRSFK